MSKEQEQKITALKDKEVEQCWKLGYMRALTHWSGWTIDKDFEKLSSFAEDAWKDEHKRLSKADTRA